MNTIEISNLSHQFVKDCNAVDSVNFKVPSGSIYGFLGKNGAGKTTTLRLILGLLTRQTGEIKIFDKDIATNRLEILSKVGSLIESPSFYAHLSARDNLRVLQQIFQCARARIDEVLEIVGLKHTGSKKVRQFSLGMKQRLSIAMSLLHSPELLVLDEPTNGLDPNGIIEMRELLISLNRDFGTTILVSSHLLSEVEKLITDLAILDGGRIVFEGTYSDLKQEQAKQTKIAFRTNDSDGTLKTAMKMGLVGSPSNMETVELDFVTPDVVASLNRALVQQDIDVFAISQQTASLEDIFINLVDS